MMGQGLASILYILELLKPSCTYWRSWFCLGDRSIGRDIYDATITTLFRLELRCQSNAIMFTITSTMKHFVVMKCT
jgi:hypothetical protein